MSNTDNLYLLVQSLSAPEKRYFTLHAKSFTSDTKTNALKLFDALCKYKTASYDENIFIKNNKGKAFSKNLSYEKNYLNDLLLRVMRSYHSDKNIDQKLQETNIDIQFLMYKGLTEQALKLINKTYDIAKEHKKSIEMLQLNSYKQSFVLKGLQHIDYDLMDNEIVEVLAKVSEDIKWYNLRYKIYALLQDPNFMNNISLIQTHIHKIEDDLSKNTLSISIRNTAINILQLYYNKIYDFEKMYSITKELVKNAENESINKKYNFNSHLINLSNMLYATLHLEKLEEMPPILEKITNLDSDSELQKIDQFKIYSQYELLYRLNTKNFNDIDSIISNIELGIKKYKSQLSTKIVTNFQFNIIVIYFISKNYSKSQSKINTLLKTFKKNENNNQLFLLITIIEVMCLYSLKSNDTAESLFRSWSRNYSNLAKEEILFTYILQFFKKISMPYDNYKNYLNQITHATNHVKWDQLKGLISEWGTTYRIK